MLTLVKPCQVAAASLSAALLEICNNEKQMSMRSVVSAHQDLMQTT